MARCRGTTNVGKKCRNNATDDGYCQLHYITECVVCLENFEEQELSLPCGHWIHRTCVQKSADAMQELRAQEGYPPIEECICPICRAPVPDLKPQAPPPPLHLSTAEVQLLVVVVSGAEMYAFTNW